MREAFSGAHYVFDGGAHYVFDSGANYVFDGGAPMYLIAVATNASCKTVWAFLLVVWKWIIDRFTIAMTRKQKIEKLATELQWGMSILHFQCLKDSQSFHSFTIPFQYKV